jgi:orotate phosphoribosyltransferase
LISTGGSSLKAVEALREAGAEVLGMVAIFSYGFELAAENFRKAGVTLHTLTSYHILVQTIKAKVQNIYKVLFSL